MLTRTPSFVGPILLASHPARQAVGRGLRATALACGVTAAAAQPVPSHWGPNVAPGSLREWMGHPHNMQVPDQNHRMSEEDRQQLRRQLQERERRRRANMPVQEAVHVTPPPMSAPTVPR